MSRPDFPNPYCILPASCISRIKSDQEAYDRDPEYFENLERIAEEERQREQEYWEQMEAQDDR